MALETSNKFITINCDINEIEVISASKIRKPVLKFKHKSTDEEMVVVGYNKIGMLADLLKTPRKKFKELVVNRNVETINSIIASTIPSKIQYSASKYNGSYFIFNISTDKFQIITFSEVQNVIYKHPQTNYNDFVRSNFNGVMVWERIYKVLEVCNDKIDIILRITSGRNNKNSAIKCIVYGRVASCENSIQAMVFTPIKHFAGWEKKLITALSNAIEIIDTMKNIIEIGATKPITLEDGNQLIDNLEFKIKDELKINRIKAALKNRFAHEHETNPNKFGLSQAYSYIGTYSLAESSSEHTLQILQQQAYTVFA